MIAVLTGLLTGTEAALLGGTATAAGVVGLAWAFLPNQVDLSDALNRLSPEHARTVAKQHLAEHAGGAMRGVDRIGLWATRRLPAALWFATPEAELRILQLPRHRFHGKRIGYALLGLVIVPFLTGLFSLAGVRVPLALPGFVSVLFSAFMFYLPVIEARDQARLARLEFTHALSAYVDLVAMERNAGSGSRQSLELAAAVCDTWVFQRIGEELSRSRWSGRPPWDALQELGEELGLPDLSELADIMRLAGEDGAGVYRQLRARSISIRNAELNRELALANETGERMSIPMSLLGVVFLAILIGPALLRMLT